MWNDFTRKRCLDLSLSSISAVHRVLATLLIRLYRVSYRACELKISQGGFQSYKTRCTYVHTRGRVCQRVKNFLARPAETRGGGRGTARGAALERTHIHTRFSPRERLSTLFSVLPGGPSIGVTK